MAITTLENGLECLFSDLLYNSECPVCGYGIQWEAEFDVYGTTYNAFCCGKRYSMEPVTYRVSIEDEEEGEDSQYANP